MEPGDVEADALRRALERRFRSATVSGPGSPLVTGHPEAAAEVAMGVVQPVLEGRDEGSPDGRSRRGETEAIAALRAAIADLDGYVGRRAAEVAAPLIAEAGNAADARVADAQAEAQLSRDVSAELRRHLEARDRQVARWREIAEGKAADLIVRCDEVSEGDRMLDEGPGFVTVLCVYTYDDHLGMDVTGEGGRRWYLSRQPDALTAVRREAPSP